MTSGFLALAWAATLALGAETPEGTFHDDPGALAPVAPGLSGVLVLRSGLTWAGEVERVDAGFVHVRVGDDAVLAVPLASVRGIVPHRVPEGTLGGRHQERVVLRDGSVLVADRVERQGTKVVLLDGGARRELESAQVRMVVSVREERDPLRLDDRHLESPSAFLPAPGDVVASSLLVSHLTVTAGLHRFLSLTAGTGVPLLQASDYGANAQLALRSGVELLPWLHLAGGVHADFAAGGTLLTASATVTAGTAASHVTLHAGPVFPGADGFASQLGQTGLALAVTLRLTPWLDGIAEGWASRRDGETGALATLAARIRWGMLGVDAGLGRSFPDAELFPWLSLHVDLSPRKVLP